LIHIGNFKKMILCIFSTMPIQKDHSCHESKIIDSDDESTPLPHWPRQAFQPSIDINPDKLHLLMEQAAQIFHIAGIVAFIYSSCPPNGWFFIFETYTNPYARQEAARLIEDIMLNACANVSLINAIPSPFNTLPQQIIDTLKPYAGLSKNTAIIIDTIQRSSPSTIKWIPLIIHPYIPTRHLSQSVSS